MQVDIERIKLVIGEQAVTICALGGEVERLAKENAELKEKMAAPPKLKTVDKA